ncbi:MAG: pseudouridylate synthase [Bacteroidales bacterium]|jgi:3-hydroxymyristoyl/3-hydroxydecanoyl-(acyl carrier protein) dehydratase|nr:pseudouridylate synthase [Bacteroidales bacterium]
MYKPSDYISAENSVLKYIPQRPPFVMVDELVFCSKEQTQTTFIIKKDNLFLVNNQFTEMGILENIAQTCAVRLGYLNRRQPIKIGVIGSVDNLEMQYLPFVGDKIITTITIMTEVLNVILLSAVVFCGEKAVATSNMKVVLTDIVSEQ